MSDLRTAAQQALEALEDYKYAEARDTLRAALEEPVQEPVATVRTWHKNGDQHAELWDWLSGIASLSDGEHTLYAAPPQRLLLTDEEIWKFWWSRPEVPDGEDDSMEAEFVAAVCRVLAAHGIGSKT